MSSKNETVALSQESQKRHSLFGTVSFTVCFAAWGLISAFAPSFRQRFHLSATQTAFLVAVPVLLGALARIPIGMLADRFGGRVVFTGLMFFVAVPVALVPSANSYQNLLIVAFLLGMAGSSFAVGVGYVSRWYSMESQGSALGVYGLGNIGQSAAVFLGPVAAATFGFRSVYLGMSIILVVWATVFVAFARDASQTTRPKGLSEMLGVLAREPLAWALAAFYFLTFGGFVAFSIYLPTLLRDQFGLRPSDAGFRTAGFVVLATLCRPLGGWLSDRIGGSRVLSWILPAIAAFGLLLGAPSMLPFTVGALGCSALLGIGNGAVFQLVPRYFPNQRATVTGLVGAMGGMGGFFPPLILGVFRDKLGIIWPGFLLLSVVACLLWWLNARVFLPREDELQAKLPADVIRTADKVRAGAWATLGTGVLVAAIVLGSRNLQNFDAALVIYTFAIIFATWGVVYHYSVWIRKPPTRVYWQRGWQLFKERGVLHSFGQVVALVGTHLLSQNFIRKRSTLRWAMHQLIFWGCLLAAAITFPLVFGWIYFTSAPNDQMVYITHFFGYPAGHFHLHTITALLLFHGLDISAILVLGGIALSLWRRMRDEGARAVQTLAMNFWPLILLFAISMTGLALTVSQEWLGGRFYDFIAILHAITVIAALLYLPFGKFFHIFQRPAQLGVKLYQQAGAEDSGAICARCGERYASRMHIDDLKKVLPQMGFNYSMPGPVSNWQELCPACKRKSLSLAQLRLKEEAHG
ncbi:MAG TPA: MFS transporter [Candidatus Sulfotelmatobacter sp.]|nr:MFS transporter [Candidatus Sulfotelmatobacter sp.]